MFRYPALTRASANPQPSLMTVKRVQREISDLKKEDMGGIRLDPSESSMLAWTGSLPGPEGSIYEGGTFEFDLQLPPDYPFSAPKIMFKTRIYHMNIAQTGHICLDILKNMWSPALSLFKVMLSLSSLLTDPNPSDPLVPAIASEYKSNPARHDATARNWTQLYAMNKSTPAPKSTAPSSSSTSSFTTNNPASGSTSRNNLANSTRTSTPVSITSSRSRPSSRPVSALSRGAVAASSSTATAPASADVIEISDDEDGPIRNGASSSTGAGAKRKRGARDDGPSATVGSGSSSSSRAVAGRTGTVTATATNSVGSGLGGSRATRHGRSRLNVGTTELIVIDDD